MIQLCFHNSWLPLPIFIYSAPRPDPSLQALCMLSLQTWTYTDRHVPSETTTNILATKKTKYIPTCTEGTGSWLLKGKSVGDVGEKERGWFPSTEASLETPQEGEAPVSFGCLQPQRTAVHRKIQLKSNM